MGFDESQITLDVIICGSPPQADSKWELNNDALTNYMLSRNIRHFYGNADSLKNEKAAYPDVNFRYLFT